MHLSNLNIPEAKQKQLIKAGIINVESLLTYFPKSYIRRTQFTGILPSGQESVLLLHITKVRKTNNSAMLVIAEGYECLSGNNIPVFIKWFNQVYLYNELRAVEGKNVVVAGQVSVNTYGGYSNFEIANPPVFDLDGENALRIYPTYRKVQGMAENYLKDCIYKAAELVGIPEEIAPEEFVRKNDLLSYGEMLQQLHWPSDNEMLEKAQKRKTMNDLLYFALRVELNYRTTAIGSPFGIQSVRIAKQVMENLPFALTADQASTLRGMYDWIREGKRVNALVQGDVGCGKTIIAFLLMIAFAENGYQAALMAPTQVLAQQHYEDLVELTEPYGLKVAFVSGQKLRKAEQTALENAISTGEVKLIVGTQALLSEHYQFKNLALVIEDEEHKYGVLQRQALIDKAACGTHTVTMSATPIPRSLALTIYGNNIQLYSIKTKPAGRLPVKTGIQAKMEPIFHYLYHEIVHKGHQAYVICPMVSPSEKIFNVATAETTYEHYKKVLEPYGITVGMVTGKTRKADAAQILHDFEDNKISVLISTTVIEVGVNVPNATAIIIHNAERFGLAQLHQLRGRVGRGKDQACCVLVSSESENKRLQALCSSTDGFEIAKIDLDLRGAGDLLGNQQSGTEKMLLLALEHPAEYRAAQLEAKRIVRDGNSYPILEEALKDQKNNIGGQMLAE